MIGLLTDADRFPFSPENVATLAASGVELRELSGHDPQEVIAAGRDASVIFVYHAKLTAELIAALPALRLIARCGTGIDGIDLEAARARGVVVTHVVGFATDEVADQTIGLLLACARRIVWCDRSLRQGIWPSSTELGPLLRLRGQVLGLVGFGLIARAVSARARALGLLVIAHDPYVDDNDFERHEAKRVASVNALLEQADFVSLHAPLTEETLGMIGRRGPLADAPRRNACEHWAVASWSTSRHLSRPCEAASCGRPGLTSSRQNRSPRTRRSARSKRSCSSRTQRPSPRKRLANCAPARSRTPFRCSVDARRSGWSRERRAVPHDAHDPPLRGARSRSRERERDRRRDTRVRRPGGDRDRRLLCASARRRDHVDAPRSRTRAREGRDAGPNVRRAARPDRRYEPRAWRLHAHRRSQSRHLRRKRDRGGRRADRCRRRLGRTTSGARSRRGLLLR